MDIRLVVSDMDGTLLPDGRVPPEFWPLLAELTERGIAFVPASGRQLATLRGLFAGEPGGEHLSYIAENGTLVTLGAEVVSTTTVPDGFARGVVDAVRAAVDDGANLGVVVCRPDGAVIERTDGEFVAECAKYYVELAQVDDLTPHCRDVLKLAIFDFDDAARAARRYFDGLDGQVVVSGKHWIDVMAADANKGHGVRMLQRRLGVTPAQTAAFGDYLNDVEMLAAADHSYAVANAHPTVAARARNLVAGNADLGVLRELREILDGREGCEKS
ncbi:Cof-type HAD-IIB family hydrolase [Gordonia sp. X0973]|uniref:Cof-type HAD-IIB family hydrolase n=1 Tax=Gordonia sp. X0973 TaxID=2742602 RepID=UPI000F54338C|nr:Cof-type HAD-IIB family hydrolase [Gordonia sp. X0973]